MKKTDDLLTVRKLVKHFDISGGFLDQLAIENKRIIRKHTTVKALNEISFSITQRETLGVVGESGCGKSTLAGPSSVCILQAVERSFIETGEWITSILNRCSLFAKKYK